MTDFIPQPILVVEAPDQIKAFTDALRLRVLRILCERAATNQQISDMLGEPHAKVLYHIRFLLDSELIKLVDTQVKGGNVEKYYRAVARTFDIRPAQIDVERDVQLAYSTLDTLRDEMITSLMTYPESEGDIWTKRGYFSPARTAEFMERLKSLLDEYWDASAPAAGPDDLQMRLAVMLYRAAPHKDDSAK
ncbi:MAG: winged helix-turn-helix domain-containing protein [Anaerolineae bacterium]